MSVLFDAFSNLDGTRTWPGFEWDDWAYTDYFYVEVTEVDDHFRKLEGLPARAYCLGSLEFVAARMSLLADVSEAISYADAAWTTMEGTDSCDYGVVERNEWSGPVLGAVRGAILIANDTLFEAMGDRQFAERCGWMLRFCRHVLEGDALDIYESWTKASIKRLSGLKGAEDAPFGPPVSPGFLLPKAPLDASRIPEDLAAHRESLDPENDWYGDFYYQS